MLEAFAALMYQGFGAVAYHSCKARLKTTIAITTHVAGKKLDFGSKIDSLLKKDSTSIIIETIKKIQKLITKGVIHCLINHALDRASPARPIQAYIAVRIRFDQKEVNQVCFWGSINIRDIKDIIIQIATKSVIVNTDHNKGTAINAAMTT